MPSIYLFLLSIVLQHYIEGEKINEILVSNKYELYLNDEVLKSDEKKFYINALKNMKWSGSSFQGMNVFENIKLLKIDHDTIGEVTVRVSIIPEYGVIIFFDSYNEVSDTSGSLYGASVFLDPIVAPKPNKSLKQD